VKAGIAPTLVAAQVESTAGWLRQDERARDVIGVLDGAPALEEAWRADPSADETQLSYLHLLLTAHFATVATFVPTDVDARIRHHAWAAMERPEQIARACDVVDEVARWDASWVSARVVTSEDDRNLSGHDGEWLGVRAGALGRAAALGAKDLVERLVADLDREVDRHERFLLDAYEGRAPAQRTLSIATIVAHDLGDLSRVVEAWPGGAGAHASLRARYTRLGHADAAPSARRRSFVLAGELNKALMALENHRFLALRKPRALRASRGLLLPIGPWFDDWGATVATHPSLGERDRADVVAALLEMHASSPDQLGCLRALAGIHRATRGGLELYVPDLPARLRKDAVRGRVREAVDVTKDHFAARIEKRFAAERERLGV
jgi:hypothetical protein